MNRLKVLTLSSVSLFLHHTPCVFVDWQIVGLPLIGAFVAALAAAVAIRAYV